MAAWDTEDTPAGIPVIGTPLEVGAALPPPPPPPPPPLAVADAVPEVMGPDALPLMLGPSVPGRGARTAVATGWGCPEATAGRP